MGSMRQCGRIWTPAVFPYYKQITADVTVTSAVEATPVDVIVGDTISIDSSTDLWVTFFCRHVDLITNSSTAVIITLWDGSTDLGRIAAIQDTGGGAWVLLPIHARRRIVAPTVGSHTFKIRAWKVGANPVIGAGAGGAGVSVPAFMLIEKATDSGI